MVTYFLSDSFLNAVAQSDELNYLHSLINSCLVAKGFEPWSKIKVEAFELDCQYLIFARPVSPAGRRLEGSFPRLKRQ